MLSGKKRVIREFTIEHKNKKVEITIKPEVLLKIKAERGLYEEIKKIINIKKDVAVVEIKFGSSLDLGGGRLLYEVIAPNTFSIERKFLNVNRDILEDALFEVEILFFDAVSKLRFDCGQRINCFQRVPDIWKYFSCHQCVYFPQN